MREKKIIVIGAGISGLSCAWFLKRSGADVLVLEAGSTPGGVMKSRRIDGFLVESGPNSTQETTPLFEEICRDTGISDERIYANDTAKYRYILRGGKLHPLPLSPPAFLKSRLFSLAAKSRLLLEPFRGSPHREESVAEFVERRLGREFLDYAINPFVAGVYAGDPRKLSVRAAFPKLFALEEEYGGLFRGMIEKRKEKKNSPEKFSTQPAGKMFSFKEGMGTLIHGLAKQMGERVLCEHELRSIERLENGKYRVGYHGEGEQKSADADEVIFSIPAYHAAGFVEKISAQLAGTLRNIEYPPVCELVLGYRREKLMRPLDGFGFLIPEKEKRRILGCIWSSSIFSHRAPEGYEELTVFIGGTRNPANARLDDDALVKMACSELADILGISGEPDFAHISRWEKAIPQYNLGYEKVIAAIGEFEKNNPGLYFCSNFRGGVSVGDCVKSAKAIAERVEQRSL